MVLETHVTTYFGEMVFREKVPNYKYFFLEWIDLSEYYNFKNHCMPLSFCFLSNFLIYFTYQPVSKFIIQIFNLEIIIGFELHSCSFLVKFDKFLSQGIIFSFIIIIFSNNIW